MSEKRGGVWCELSFTEDESKSRRPETILNRFQYMLFVRRILRKQSDHNEVRFVVRLQTVSYNYYSEKIIIVFINTNVYEQYFI